MSNVINHESLGMPFDKYMQEDVNTSVFSNYEDSHSQLRADMLGISTSTVSPLRFQMPQFMRGPTPTLAPGGGAEVIPAGFAMHTSGSSWFANNGFTPFPDHSSFQQEKPPDQDHPWSSSSLVSRGFDSLPESASLLLSQSSLLSLASSGYPTPAVPLGLPVYSASGFDILNILARVAYRPNPKIVLGPVDLTCSFVVVDVRRHDSPVVYCSPSFCKLTGYSEHEILNRNCRFLQAPDGNVQRGQPRHCTNSQAVAHLRKSLIADKEYQTSIVNYRKDGSAFINLVTVIPITGGVSGQSHESDEVVYHIGFQVDLTEQPNAILEKLKDGSYLVNYSSSNAAHPPGAGQNNRDRKQLTSVPAPLSRELALLLTNQDFVRSAPISGSTTVSSSHTDSSKTDVTDLQTLDLLQLMILENSPDFVLVVSLKGSFLYVAPAVKHILGYDPQELVGKSIADFCHPADVVPVMRELKESSVTPGHGSETYVPVQSTLVGGPPKPVDIMFRAREKSGDYVWAECRGRLHIEPGKGRKAIVLSARTRAMPALLWDMVERAGGVTSTSIPDNDEGDADNNGSLGEFWGMLSTSGAFLVVGPNIKSLLGWDANELLGKSIGSLLSDEAIRTVENELAQLTTTEHQQPSTLWLPIKTKTSITRDVNLVLYPPTKVTSSPCPIIFQAKIMASQSDSSPQLAHPLSTNVFDELDTTRSSRSWRYELQQLKYANQRLMDELTILERAPSPRFIAPASVATSPVLDSSQSSPQMNWPSNYALPKSLKRAWDDVDGLT